MDRLNLLIFELEACKLLSWMIPKTFLTENVTNTPRQTTSRRSTSRRPTSRRSTSRRSTSLALGNTFQMSERWWMIFSGLVEPTNSDGAVDVGWPVGWVWSF